MSALGVVIVGAPRSGTYWLVDLLQQRFNIIIPSETHFIPLFARYLWLWGDLRERKNRARLLRNIFEFLQIWTARSSHSKEYIEQIRQLSLLVTLDEGRVDAILDSSENYVTLIDALFTQFALLHGSDASGDKSAYFRALDPEEILAHAPDARMLHIVRDGRDVALSWLKQWFGPDSMADAAQKWCEHVQTNRTWGARNPDRYLELRYEALATDLEAEIEKIAVFLQRPAIKASESAKSSPLAEALAKTDSHASMLDIVASDNVARWKRDMSEADVALFESIAQDTLKECCYELRDSSGTKIGRRRHFAAHELRVLAKNSLPLVLGVAGRLHLPLLWVINQKFPAIWRRVSL